MSSTEKCFAKNAVAEIPLLMKKTVIGVSTYNNNGVEKINGRLVVQKRVCDQKLLIHKKSMIEIASRQRGFMAEKQTLLFVIYCQKIVVNEKTCLENL